MYLYVYVLILLIKIYYVKADRGYDTMSQNYLNKKYIYNVSARAY